MFIFHKGYWMRAIDCTSWKWSTGLLKFVAESWDMPCWTHEWYMHVKFHIRGCLGAMQIYRLRRAWCRINWKSSCRAGYRLTKSWTKGTTSPRSAKPASVWTLGFKKHLTNVYHRPAGHFGKCLIASRHFPWSVIVIVSIYMSVLVICFVR